MKRLRHPVLIVLAVWLGLAVTTTAPAQVMPAPPPAYNTVSTIIRILEQKGFVGHEVFGRTHRYRALVAQDEYRRFSLRKLLGGYFGNSFPQLVSFFAKQENMDLQELDELMKHVKEDLNDKADE